MHVFPFKYEESHCSLFSIIEFPQVAGVVFAVHTLFFISHKFNFEQSVTERYWHSVGF